MYSTVVVVRIYVNFTTKVEQSTMKQTDTLEDRQENKTERLNYWNCKQNIRPIN